MQGRILVNTFGVGTVALFLGTSSPWAAQDIATVHRQLESGKPVEGVIDVLNLFPQVGALLIVGIPNDVGFPVGIVAFSSGTLIHERAFLTAGHFTGPASFAPLPPFIKAFVSLSPNALDPSTWRPVVEQITHPSIPPCPPPLGCDPTTQDVFHALDPGISDIGLAFLAQPVRGIRPARLAEIDALESRTAGRLPMIFVGYGFTGLGPGGEIPPPSEWDRSCRSRNSAARESSRSKSSNWYMKNIACQLEHSVEAEVSPSFVWNWRTDIKTWDDPPAQFQLDGPFASGSGGTTLMPGGESLRWQIRDVRPGASFIIELPLDGAVMSFEWLF